MPSIFARYIRLIRRERLFESGCILLCSRTLLMVSMLAGQTKSRRASAVSVARGKYLVEQVGHVRRLPHPTQ